MRIGSINFTYFVFDRASLIDLTGDDYFQMFYYYFGQVICVSETEIGVYHGVVVVVEGSAVFGDFWKSSVFDSCKKSLKAISDKTLEVYKN